MTQKIDEGVSVTLVYDHERKKVFPKSILWQRRLYPIIKLGLHHTFREGRTLYHVFSVASQNLFFRLELNTENLQWTLKEVSDGESN